MTLFIESNKFDAMILKQAQCSVSSSLDLKPE